MARQLTPPEAARAARTAPASPRGRRRAELAAAGCAALLAMAAYCVGTGVHGIYPFGPHGRAVNDLGNQFVPMHAQLWGLMHGAGGGDLLFNWNSAFGVPFLADFFTYLANPFSWLVGLFPRADADLPVFLVTLLSIGLAAAVMTGFLGRLRPGSPWLRALLAAGYAICVWAVNDAEADPMWLWGLVALPMAGIALDWALRERRWVAGSLLVAAAWCGNFYTGAMALLCGVLVLLVRLGLDERARPEKVRVLGRAAGMLAVGTALAAPVLLVCWRAARAAQPAPAQSYRLHNPLDFLAGLLPGSRTGFAPDVAFGVLGLLLLLAFPFQRRIPARERWAWSGLLVVVAGSFLWKPTLLLWQGGALPNGSPYREAFVLSGLMTMVAWLSLTRRPGPRPLLCAATLTLLIAAVATARTAPVRDVWPQAVLVAGVALAGLLALGRAWPGRRVVAGLALGAAVLGGSAWNISTVTAHRSASAFLAPHITVGDARARAAYAAVRAADDWPAGRSDPGPHQFADNDPMLLNGQGGGYYSSYVPAVTARTAQALGLGWFIQGRHLLSPHDPGSRALLGITAYLDSSGSARYGFVQVRAAAAPLVTVRPAATARTAVPSGDPFALQNLLLGAPVWTAPAVGRTAGALTASCPAGEQVYLDAPWFTGSAREAGHAAVGLYGEAPMTANPLRYLGTVPAGGTVRVALTADPRYDVLPAHPLGCLSPAALAGAVAHLRATGATRVTAGGHALTARLPHGHPAGLAVVATTAVPGWRCTVDGRAARTVSDHGLLAVALPRGASVVSCSYATPGLRPGLAGTGAGLVALAAVPGTLWWRRHRKAG